MLFSHYYGYYYIKIFLGGLEGRPSTFCIAVRLWWWDKDLFLFLLLFQFFSKELLDYALNLSWLIIFGSVNKLAWLIDRGFSGPSLFWKRSIHVFELGGLSFWSFKDIILYMVAWWCVCLSNLSNLLLNWIVLFVPWSKKIKVLHMHWVSIVIKAYHPWNWGFHRFSIPY